MINLQFGIRKRIICADTIKQAEGILDNIYLNQEKYDQELNQDEEQQARKIKEKEKGKVTPEEVVKGSGEVAAEGFPRKVFGLDMEWRKGKKVALLQLAYRRDVFLFRLAKMRKVPPLLAQFLMDSSIAKVSFLSPPSFA